MHWRKAVMGIFAVFLCFLFFVTTHAQQNSGTRTKSQPTELGVSAIYEPCEDPSSELCVPYPSNVSAHPDPANRDHEMALVGQALPPNTDIYVVGCITTEGSARCTTGDSGLDATLNNTTGGDQMSPDPTHTFRALQNPVKSSPDGTLSNVIVRSFTPQTTIHFFRAYHLTTATLGGTTGSATSVKPSPEGMQLGTARFPTVTPIPTASPIPTFTLSRDFGKFKFRIFSDPRGRIFDSQSLEPIPDVEVSLLSNVKKLAKLENFQNPQKVKANGLFTFWTPNGVYYLNPSKKPAGYIWPVKPARVNPNYKKAYYCESDVRDEQNRPALLYLQQYQIRVVGKMVHCDVPMDPGSRSPYRGEVKTGDYSQRKPNNTSTIYTGIVSHPLTIVTLQGETSGKIIRTATADRFGLWEMTVENASHPLKDDGIPDRLIAKYKKTDLTGQTAFTAQNGITFEPVLTYIEGYAYDEKGSILPSAIVGYKQVGTDKVVNLTTADTKGFFKIPSNYLPSLGYELVFIAGGKTVTQSTSDFASSNSKYLKENSLNLLTDIRAGAIPQNNAVLKFSGDDAESAANAAKEKQKAEQNSALLIAGLILTLLTVSAVVMIVMIKRRNSPPTPAL